jgi:hypothetical protein
MGFFKFSGHNTPPKYSIIADSHQGTLVLERKFKPTNTRNIYLQGILASTNPNLMNCNWDSIIDATTHLTLKTHNPSHQPFPYHFKDLFMLNLLHNIRVKENAEVWDSINNSDFVGVFQAGFTDKKQTDYQTWIAFSTLNRSYKVAMFRPQTNTLGRFLVNQLVPVQNTEHITNLGSVTCALVPIMQSNIRYLIQSSQDNLNLNDSTFYQPGLKELTLAEQMISSSLDPEVLLIQNAARELRIPPNNMGLAISISENIE